VTILLFSPKLFAQKLTLKAIEDDLHKSYLKILDIRFNNGTTSYDSLEKENNIFIEKIQSYTSNYPLTLTYKFDSLRKDNINIHIVNSEDNLFRIYSWDTWMGGTMHDFKNIFQYRSGNKVYSRLSYDTTDQDYIPFYSQIFTLKANNKVYYLAIYNGIYSTKDASQSIRIFTIQNHSLNDKVKLIKTSSGLVNSIDVYFDFFSVVDRPERPLRLIKYDQQKRIIYIPIVDDSSKVTKRFILYQFNGNVFKRVK